MKLLHVVAAVILDKDSNVLIARRLPDKHMGGLWEFPGGKVEAEEAVTEALCRELDEELGIQPDGYQPLVRIQHHYPDKSVLLDVWTVTSFRGSPHGREGQPVRWVSKAELSDFEFPAANRPIVTAAQLPSRYMVTGVFSQQSELLEKVRTNLESGLRMVQFRAPWLSDDQYRLHVQALLPLFAHDRRELIVKGSLDWLECDGVAGLHLTSRQLEQLHAQGWHYTGDRRLIASCHNADELKKAAEIGVHCATLSPVLVTSSHPEAKPLGWGESGRDNRSGNYSCLLHGWNDRTSVISGYWCRCSGSFCYRLLVVAGRLGAA